VSIRILLKIVVNVALFNAVNMQQKSNESVCAHPKLYAATRMNRIILLCMLKSGSGLCASDIRSIYGQSFVKINGKYSTFHGFRRVSVYEFL